ncbi:MAG: efflux RND transporter permease subunit, partial [Armatimonadota bacterium]|nr:efflux RND transporter permease subunit [Armatimonadota bacterium]
MIKYIQRHSRAILFITVGLLLIGLFSIVSMPVSIFPPLTIPRIVIAAEGGDAPAQAILVSVTRPLEGSLSTIPGLELIQSQTTRGSVGFTLTFQWGTDIQAALQLVNAHIAEQRATIPAGIDITAERLNPTIFPILDYSITSKTRSLADLRSLATYTIRPRLARLPGVARVMINGGQIQEFQVNILANRLAAHGLSAQQVEDALSKSNSITAVGNFDNHYLRHLVLVNGQLGGVEAIRRVVVDVKDRVPVSIGDVASVEETLQQQKVIATGSGSPAVLLNIIRQPTGNTIAVAQAVKDELAADRSVLPSDVQIKPFYDQSQIVQESESSVVESILVGGILALILLIVFLANGRAALTALSLLPLTLIITFGVMRALGLDLNIMTLGAMAIALGLVIDDSIVVVEHIYHHLERGLPRKEAIDVALGEITPAMISSSAASMVTFLPLVFLPGVIGNFFSALAVTVIATLFVSLVLSLTVCPALALRTLPLHLKEKETKSSSNGHVRRGIYARLSAWCLSHRAVVLLALIPLAIGTYFLSQRLQTGFMPEFDEGAFVMDYKMPPGTSLAETDRVLTQIEKIIAHTEGVQSWSRLTGALSGSGLEITPQNQGDVVVRLVNGKRPAVDDITSELRTKVQAAAPNIEIDFAQILGDLIGDLSGSPSPVEVKIFGPDMKVLQKITERVGDKVKSATGVVDEQDTIIESGPQAEV